MRRSRGLTSALFMPKVGAERGANAMSNAVGAYSTGLLPPIASHQQVGFVGET